jgi:hypothetical protein
MFHHDPGHTDADIDRLAESLQSDARRCGVEVLAAYEGLVLEF